MSSFFCLHRFMMAILKNKDARIFKDDRLC